MTLLDLIILLIALLLMLLVGAPGLLTLTVAVGAMVATHFAKGERLK